MPCSSRFNVQMFFVISYVNNSSGSVTGSNVVSLIALRLVKSFNELINLCIAYSNCVHPTFFLLLKREMISIICFVSSSTTFTSTSDTVLTLLRICTHVNSCLLSTSTNTNLSKFITFITFFHFANETLMPMIKLLFFSQRAHTLLNSLSDTVTISLIKCVSVNGYNSIEHIYITLFSISTC